MMEMRGGGQVPPPRFLWLFVDWIAGEMVRRRGPPSFGEIPLQVKPRVGYERKVRQEAIRVFEEVPLPPSPSSYRIRETTEEGYRGTDNSQRNRGMRSSLFLRHFSVPL
jgi:hypothetical protein